jgi:hypothetical protein
MKGTDHLPHAANTRDDPRISTLLGRFGGAGYGWYWILMEMMLQAAGYKLDIPGDYPTKCIYAIQLHTDLDTSEAFINFCIHEIGLFESDEANFWSPVLCSMPAGKKKGRKRPEYPEDSTYYKMAAYFKAKIDAMAAAEGLTHLTDRTNIQVWADDFRKLVELDKQTDRELIKSVMDWVVKDEFWRSNILSAEKFRTKFAQLVIEMRRPAKKNNRSGGYSGKPHIPIIEPTKEQPAPTPDEMAEMIKLAERLQEGNKRSSTTADPPPSMDEMIKYAERRMADKLAREKERG